MSEHTPLTEAEREALTRALLDNDEHEGDWLIDYVFPAVERIKAAAHRAGVNRGWGLGFKHTTAALAARTSTATADTGHKAGCQEFPTGWLCVSDCTTVWHDKATADTGLRERVEALAEQLAAAEIADLRDHHAAEVFALLDATPASTEDRADNEGTP